MLHVRSPTRATYAVVAGLAVVTLAPALVPFPLERSGTATVAAVQGDVPGTGLNVPAVHREVTANHVRLTEDLADAVAAGEKPLPDFVVWPENSTAVDPFLDTEVHAGIVAASDAIGVPILVGGTNSNPLDDTQVLNQGIVYQPGLGSGDRYTKRHPVPYGEYIPFRGSSWMPSTYGRLTEVPRDMVRGTSLEPIRVGDLRVADAICFDVAYDEGIAGQVSRGAELVTVQTSNAMFSRTGQLAQQFEISRLRAQETGRWVVVAAINGISGVVRPDGTVVASVPARGQEVLVEDVGLSTTRTLAVRLGVWPGRLVMLFLVLHTAVVLITYRRRRQRDRAGHQLQQPAAAPATRGARYARVSVDGLGRCVMVVPTYDESENLEWIVGRLRAAQPGVDVLVVDDNSPDGTGDLADRLAAADPAVKVVHRTEKAGLGAAYLHGFDVALRAGYDVIGEMDADGSHQPEQLQRLLDALHTADLVIGSRYVPGGSVVNWPVQRLLLSRGGNLYVRLLLGIRVKDATAGYRLFRRTTLEAIDLGSVRSTGYVFQTDLAYRTVSRGLRLTEVPIEFIERERGDSKMSGQVASESLRMITRWGLSERRRQLRRSRVRA